MIKIKTNLFRVTTWTVLLVGLAILIAGCQTGAIETQGGGAMPDSHKDPMTASNKPPDPPAKGEVQIVIENFVFTPAEVTVSPGTKVTWINKDEAPHTATSTDTPSRFNSGGLDTDDKFSFVFNDKGDYPYFCALHPHMKAMIKVK